MLDLPAANTLAQSEGSALIGEQLGGYRIEAEIGRGGMGIVYLAEQPRLGRRVALKVITPELAHDVDFRNRFERESRLAASIDHPNVVPVYEAGEADGLLYIAMRHVRGTDMKALLTTDGRLEPGRAAQLIGQVAAALDAAHSSGLVHRDVKPANVLLEAAPDGERAYLSDFGLTKRSASTTQVTKTGFVVGTLDYVAPEQVHGGPVDARTDVYALACVLFHALSGRVPYERTDDMAKMYAHAELPPPSLHEAAPGIPPELDDVVQRGMAKDPDDRFPSAGDLGRAAIAAAGGAAPAVAERTVATGDAAPVAATVTDGEGPPTGPTHPLPASQPAPPPPPRHTPPQPPQYQPPTPPQRPAPPPMAPAAPPPGSRTGVVIAVIAVVALGAAAAALLATGVLGGDDDEPSPARTTGATTEPAREPPPETVTEPAPRRTPSATRFEPYVSSSGDYETVLPAGEGWTTPSEEIVNEGLVRTTTTGPAGLQVIIDHTPGEAATFKPADRCRQISHPQVPYAARCVFRGGTLAPCRRTRCVDYLLNAGVDGPGWGVLVGGGDFATTQAIARRVADSLTPTG